MSNIKGFKDFINESVEYNADPILRKDLIGKPYDKSGVPELEIVHAIEFPAGGTFDSHYAAEKYLDDMGYTTGSSEGGNPTGFSDKFSGISKWWNMSRDEHKQLDGVFLSGREGPSLILWFNIPRSVDSSKWIKKINEE